MEKKFKFSDKSAVAKMVYLTVIAILCVSALVIGIVAANSRRRVQGDNKPPASEGQENNTDSGDGGDNFSGNQDSSGGNDSGGKEDTNTSKEIIYISPLAGTVIKSHSTSVPVFSNTLDAWRIHTGIDILCGNGAEVFASAVGEVSGVYIDPMLGQTVEITHTDNVKTYYSNLASDTVVVKVGDAVESGDLIGYVGDTTVIELADEPHLHFEVKVNSVSVNPLDYISGESKSASLGIVSEPDA